MKYTPLEAPSAAAIERFLKLEVKRMTELVAEGKAKRRRSAAEQALIAIMLGEKFAFQHLLWQLRRARRRKGK